MTPVCPLVICPGWHQPQLTEAFLAALMAVSEPPMPVWLVPPTCPPYSGWQIAQFLREQRDRACLPDEPNPALAMISFSAGVVGAIGAAHLWQLGGGNIAAFIACDGWGVPLLGDFPIYRVSHDAFTHWTTAGWEGREGFYADPPVAHLDLWRSPNQVRGWWLRRSQRPMPTTAVTVIHHWLANASGYAKKGQ